MRKKIAVFICAISFSSQKRILAGILQEAKKADYDVFVFTCHLNHSASYVKISGAFSVMMLPDFKNFDGVIIMKSTIRQDNIADELVKKIKESKVPAVSLEEDIDGMHYSGISDYDAQKKIVDHIIEEHQAKNICYVTGVLDNGGGKERYLAFQDSMKEHGLNVDKDNVFLGNYIGESGRLSVNYFLSQSQKIDAIICANDAMALGVIEELSRAGLRVPEDIMVTGFDNDTYSRYSMPMLTTVDQNQEEIGSIAVRLIAQTQSGEYAKKVVESSLILGESCGCLKEVNYSIEEVRKAYGEEIGVISRAVDTMKNMSIDLTELTSMEELYQKLRKYIEVSDMDAFYLCNESDDSLEIPLSYVNGQFNSIPAYPKGIVLPDEQRDTVEPQFYIVTSLFFGEKNFGYIIQRGSKFALESELAYSWVVNVGLAIENIRKIEIMQEMVDRLNTMWMYDTLTNLYNRGGFYHVVNPLLENINKENSKCYLMFFDLDGLKKVNDNLGHEIGDKYIVSMARVLRNTIDIIANNEPNKAPIAMRYGGDEFVLFGQCSDSKLVDKVTTIIDREIDKINASQEKFSLSYSAGVSVIDSIKFEDLNRLIEEADKKMYESKKSKR